MRKITGEELDLWILGKPGPLRWLRTAVFLYLLLAIIAQFLFPVMMYHPPAPGYGLNDPQIVHFETLRGKKLCGIFHKNPQATYTLLYSHGNATDIGYANDRLIQLRDAGFNVFAYDYQGYGLSSGTPSESHSYQDIQAAYHYLTETVMHPEGSIILYGRSMGSGPTIELAGKTAPAGVIIESGFTSAFRVMTRIPLFPFDKYKNIQKIDGLTMPLLVMHGEADRTIPLSHGKALYERAASRKTALWIPHRGHNNLNLRADNGMQNAIQTFAESLSLE